MTARSPGRFAVALALAGVVACRPGASLPADRDAGPGAGVPGDAGATADAGAGGTTRSQGGAGSSAGTKAQAGDGGSKSHAGSAGKAQRPPEPSDGGQPADGQGDGGAGGAGSGDAATGNTAGGTGSDDAGATGSAGAGAGATGDDSGEAPSVQIPGWSVRQRVHAPGGGDLVLEQVLMSFLVADPGRTRIEHLGASGVADRMFEAPDGAFLTDFCLHPSGEISALLVVGAERSLSLVRLNASLSVLSVTPVHDPEVPNDLPADLGDSSPPQDLFVNGLATDAARIAPVGEDVVFVVYSSRYSVIAYRSSYAGGIWSAPARTLVEPPLYLATFLPTGGSFDTFGAIADWYRAYVDTDEEGRAFIAVWAHPVKITAHVTAFHDGLSPLHPEIPHNSDADVLLTRLDRDGARAWSRVIGTENEDEPYAIRAAHGEVAVLGRSRRFFGNDNTAWDAFVSVSTGSGTLVGSRAIPLDRSSILLAGAARPDGTWVVGGSDGWSQNPDGLSIGDGHKLLFELASIDAEPVLRSLPAGPRHNEVRTVSVEGSTIRYGGHEDGPSMHTGDADHTLIRATGVIGNVGE